MEKDGLPSYSPYDELANGRGQRKHHRRWRPRKLAFRVALLLALTYTVYTLSQKSTLVGSVQLLSTERLRADHDKCSKLRSVPQNPAGSREYNARYNGAKPTLIKNATIWTGEPAPGTSVEEAHLGKGYTWTNGDVLLEHGLIKRVAESISTLELPDDCEVYDGTGRMLTSGIVDMHSHGGVAPLPDTTGGNDDNELSSDITPYVRSLDAINPLDPQLQVIKSGGVTTSLVLPGSGNNMGGEAYVIKLAVGKPDGRSEISAEDMLADPEHNWRYMKMACGENAKRVYGKVGRNFGPFSRMGEAWYFRHAFEQAQQLVSAQDDWCAAADSIGAESMTGYLPQELEWESLGALLRGQVLLNTHCYTVPDLEAFIRHTNEFKFSVRAFHHAHQTYLVPEILKRNFGGRPPAAALFADNMYYKTESYIGSEQAGKILYENGITPVYVSDNPVINAQHVLFEAAKAYKNGLPYHVALAGVTSASAELLGLGERIGKVKEGFDGDIALWDSDPLSVGATPVQVWIDGAPQFKDPVELEKPAAKPIASTSREEPLSETFESYEAAIFTNVSKVMLPGQESTLQAQDSVIFMNGKVTCIGRCDQELQSAASKNLKVVDLKNGYIVPPATAFGSYLGIEEISAESTTNDGDNNGETFSAAIDGLSLDTKQLEAAYAHGVTKAISAPAFEGGGHRGSSVGFRVGASHALEKGAVFKPVVGVHYSLTLNVKQGKTPSISSAVGELKVKLLKALDLNETKLEPNYEQQDLYRVVRGELPLVITTQKADVIASLISLKGVIDKLLADKASESSTMAPKLRLVIIGGAEAHIVAPELAAADIPVVLAPVFPYAVLWDQRRSLTGAPLTNGTSIDVLHEAGVKIAFGVSETWETRDMYLMAGIAHINSGGKISEEEALAMISSNVYDMVGIEEETGANSEFVVFEGNPLDIGSRLRAVSDGRGKVDVWI